MSAAPVGRLATADDVPVIATLLDAFNREYDTPTPGPEVLAGNLRELLGSSAPTTFAPTTFAVVAGTPVRAVGLVTLRTNVWVPGGVALLDELYTVPDHRNEGLGSVVLDFAVAEATRRGAGEFEIEVDEPDVDAHRFYARHGFPVCDPVSGDRAFVLRRELGSLAPGSPTPRSR
ncbi:GNAT family N-acetyltransferase [Gordonia desulfuricans]|uniref:GNAT family N-acetyltransferase n=1 Tax=Gordonia desulfuricans TaxID=89051 RepID=A0A7K3LL59_9ACTN|nr:GNAT family N-acetyltransferase [Gordonia desulfuricans]NDK88958.1 GNAT family N-acetyltransferase [Gordonia desulfuricans]